MVKCCKNCGEEFTPLKKETRRRFCSLPCAYAGRALEKRPIADRFWEKVRKTRSCWVWTGSLDPQGYGRIAGPNSENWKASRVSWEISRGPIPLGLNILHHCDRPICVKPDHLFLGTQKDNMMDAASKKRIRNMALLTPKEKRSMRKKFDKGTSTVKELALEFKIGYNQAYSIIWHQRALR